MYWCILIVVYGLGFIQVGITAIANLMAETSETHFDVEKVKY